jgi:hypothetical protein
MSLYWSKGTLVYGADNNGLSKLNVLVDPGIVSLYRALIPPYYTANPQMYAPHISVVRKETPPNMEFWGKYEGEVVEYAYSPEIHRGTVYWWLNAFCVRLEEIRTELGLPVSSQYTMPPEGFVKCFHITLGNSK